MSEDQTTLFDENGALTENIDDKNLDVAFLSFIKGEKTNWRDLFSGYDTIRVITYSSGMEFMTELLGLFQKAEVILGCERIMSYSMAEVMAFQHSILQRIADNTVKDTLVKRIKAEELRLFVTRTKISHEKIYLLSSNDGRRRVITGSANMSRHAFTAMQRENICCVDGAEVYDYYLDIYNELLTDCTDEITVASIAAVVANEETDNIDDLPISQTVKQKKGIIIEPDKTVQDEIEFVLNVANLSEKYKKVQPKVEKNGKQLIVPGTLKTIKANIKEENAAKKMNSQEFPQLIIDVQRKSVSLNDVAYDLHPNPEEISNDVDLFMQYMDGFTKFHGRTDEMQLRYFEFANWFFCSPFMAVMRDTAATFDQQNLPYPVFGIIYGQSKAGKTSFLETLLKMMIGQKTKIPAREFTRKTIDALRNQVKGAPIIVDDLTKTRFDQHAIETIKNDMFGQMEHNVTYPAVVISANEDLKSVSQEIIRRTIICHVSAGLTNTEMMKSNMVKKVQRQIGTAFYREYLRLMMDIIPDMLEELKDDENLVTPDILYKSSEIICDIISQHYDSNIPEYIRKVDIDSYFGEKKTGSNAIQTIKTAWKTNREVFEVKKREGKLIYKAGQTYEAERIIKELPETLLAERSVDRVIMDLKKAQDFFDESFNKTFFDKLRKI